jgi:hypothetical protein
MLDLPPDVAVHALRHDSFFPAANVFSAVYDGPVSTFSVPHVAHSMNDLTPKQPWTDYRR